MKTVDRLLQQWRFHKSRPYLAKGARVLDVGCADGAFYKRFGGHVGEVVGIDPNLGTSVDQGPLRLIAGRFPEALNDVEPFDAITMLAVLEHIPLDEQQRWAAACVRLLRPAGYLIITTPSPIVDGILRLLKSMRVIDGMSLEEHYGFEPSRVPPLFTDVSMELVEARRFQLGCNNLFVFRNPGIPAAAPTF
jgi:2-polyprenyl-3-methyl-5-hydroxy-6-metoxy-1,4-benzoquinol methylase